MGSKFCYKLRKNNLCKHIQITKRYNLSSTELADSLIVDKSNKTRHPLLLLILHIYSLSFQLPMYAMDVKHQILGTNKQSAKQKLKGRAPNSNGNGNGNGNGRSKFLGVRQRPSGKWVAEIKNTTKKIRMWLGTFNTAEDAARAYDEAAFLLRGSNTRTNFPTRQLSPNSPLSLKIRNLLHQKHLALTTIPKTTNIDTTTSSSSHFSFDHSSSISQDVAQVVEDAYRPDMSSCQLGGLPQFDQQLCAFPSKYQYDELPLDQGMEMPKMELSFPSDQYREEEVAITEFERMRVERQISASLYAMNGVNEYLENAYLSADLWNFPNTLTHLFCPT